MSFVSRQQRRIAPRSEGRLGAIRSTGDDAAVTGALPFHADLGLAVDGVELPSALYELDVEEL